MTLIALTIVLGIAVSAVIIVSIANNVLNGKLNRANERLAGLKNTSTKKRGAYKTSYRTQRDQARKEREELIVCGLKMQTKLEGEIESIEFDALLQEIDSNK